MKKMIFFFIIYIKIQYALLNLENSGIDLLNGQSSIELTIYDKYMNNMHFKFIKKIKRSATITNYIQINDTEKVETDIKDIDNFFYINGRFFICPTDNNNLNEFFLDNLTKPKIFNDICFPGNWELKCYYDPQNDEIFVSHLEKKNFGSFFSYNINRNDEIHVFFINEVGMADYIIRSELSDNSKYIDNIYRICFKENKLYLEKIVDFKKNMDGKDNELLFLDYYSTYIYGNFDKKSNIFYWFSCNRTYEFRSGYSNEIIDDKTKNISLLNITKNNISPLRIYNNYKINKIKFIRKTKYYIGQIILPMYIMKLKILLII